MPTPEQLMPAGRGKQSLQGMSIILYGFDPAQLACSLSGVVGVAFPQEIGGICSTTSKNRYKIPGFSFEFFGQKKRSVQKPGI